MFTISFCNWIHLDCGADGNVVVWIMSCCKWKKGARLQQSMFIYTGYMTNGGACENRVSRSSLFMTRACQSFSSVHRNFSDCRLHIGMFHNSGWLVHVVCSTVVKRMSKAVNRRSVSPQYTVCKSVGLASDSPMAVYFAGVPSEMGTTVMYYIAYADSNGQSDASPTD